MSKLIYHYTTGDTLSQILNDRALTAVKIDPNNENEIPTVVFSTNTEWERTRYRVAKLEDGRILAMDKRMMAKYCAGVYRISVDSSVAPLSWKEMKEQLGLHSETIESLYELHKQVGAKTSEWFAATRNVPEEEWVTLERLSSDGRWISLLEDHEGIVWCGSEPTEDVPEV